LGEALKKFFPVHRPFRSFLPIVASLVFAACNRGDPHGAPPSPSADPSSPDSAHAAAPPPPAPAHRPAGPAELSIVAPLVVGAELEGFSVGAIDAVEDGIVVLSLEKERARVRLWIALAADGGPEPPASAGKYAVFYALRGADPSDGERLARALAAILEKHADAPVPPGMTKFVPKPQPI
jgi:hypothetical protein